MTKITLSVAAVAAGLTLFSCSPKTAQPETDPLVAHIDTTVSAADDFFEYANGRWFKDHPIPASEQSNGLWQLIQDTINAQIQDVCRRSAAEVNAAKGSNKQKIGDFYFSGMDSITRNSKALADIKPDMDRIDAIADLKGLFTEVAHLHKVAGAPMFSFYVGQDAKISTKNAVYVEQGGLNLPDRSFYFDTDDRSKMIREKYLVHLTNMFTLMGVDAQAAKQTADRQMKLETALAQASRKREDLRDPHKNYNKMTVAGLVKLAPNVDWALFFSQVGLQNADSVIVGQPEFLTALDKSLKAVSLQDWKDYLKFQLVSGLSSYLDDKTYRETFSFYATTLRGVPEPKPRWKRVVTQTNSSLGELIGQVYVDEYLPKGTKEKLQEIGQNIKQVYAERIKNLDWMSDATKTKALGKLETVVMKVGYPDKWKDMSSVEVSRDSYVKNVLAVNLWGFNRMISKFGKPVDRTEWGMYPQTYNAYYNPSNNEIVVPGCNILVPGFERKLADDAILYAIIGGSTFGHEITHGFDDQGSKFDSNGNLNSWWSPEDSVKFYGKTKMIVKQFDAYIPVDSLHINGELTQGENIADLGGIVMGYEAFRKTSQYKNNEKVAGLTPDQRFFLGYAMAWMINERPEAIANQVKTDEHSPAKYRVLGPLSNMPEFYAAFGVKEGNKMYRPDSLRVKIW